MATEIKNVDKLLNAIAIKLFIDEPSFYSQYVHMIGSVISKIKNDSLSEDIFVGKYSDKLLGDHYADKSYISISKDMRNPMCFPEYHRVTLGDKLKMLTQYIARIADYSRNMKGHDKVQSCSCMLCQLADHLEKEQQQRGERESG